jgi:hypothetical protein
LIKEGFKSFTVLLIFSDRMEENSYQSFETRARKLFPNINPATLIRIVRAYNPFYTTITGAVITYKSDVSIPKKEAELSKNEKILCTNKVGNKMSVTFQLESKSDLETLIELSKDKDVKMID